MLCFCTAAHVHSIIGDPTGRGGHTSYPGSMLGLRLDQDGFMNRASTCDRRAAALVSVPGTP